MFGHNDNDIVSQDQKRDAHVPMTDTAIDDITNSSVPPVGDSLDSPMSSFDNAFQTEPSEGIFKPGPSTDQASIENTLPASSDALSPDHDKLMELKHGALASLSPLVGTLDLDPTEKFKTLMMMIQAADDHSLLNEAYETAQKITDKKDRAQALLDVVNEINYFTQHKESNKN